MTDFRVGYEAEVGRFRAKARTIDPELDSSTMVQELVARLRFTVSKTDVSEKTILDYGCGTGLALGWLQLHVRPGRLVGLDISEGAIQHAKDKYPGIDFRVLDIEKATPDLHSQFDLVLSFEVLEHLANPDSAVRHVAQYYLRPEGVFVVTTPNRLVFSAGMEPSPINLTHIHEMDLMELSSLLHKYFGHVSMYGMRFHDPVRRAEHARMVRRACDGSRVLGRLWWNAHANRLYRWIWRRELLRVLGGSKYHTWRADDFEFIQTNSDIADSAIWFVAICASPIR